MTVSSCFCGRDEEVLEHPLRVIAALDRLGDARFAGGKHAREQHRALHLRAGHRAEVIGCGLSGRAFDDERRPVILALGGDLRAHLGERLDHALHRALRERGVADQPAAERLPGQRSREQAHGGAGVAAIDLRVSVR